MTRRITLAAAKTPDGKVWSVPRPGRHDSVLRAIFEAGVVSPFHEVQGFLDDGGAFLTRDEAEIVARASGQLSRPLIGGVLTSEDLWGSWRCGYDVNEQRVIGGCGAIYERPIHKRNRFKRINQNRRTICPECGQSDALNGRSR